MVPFFWCYSHLNATPPQLEGRITRITCLPTIHMSTRLTILPTHLSIILPNYLPTCTYYGSTRTRTRRWRCRQDAMPRGPHLSRQPKAGWKRKYGENRMDKTRISFFHLVHLEVCKANKFVQYVGNRNHATISRPPQQRNHN